MMGLLFKEVTMKTYRDSVRQSSPDSELVLRAALAVGGLRIRQLRGEDVGPNPDARLAHLRQIIRAGDGVARA